MTKRDQVFSLPPKALLLPCTLRIFIDNDNNRAVENRILDFPGSQRLPIPDKPKPSHPQVKQSQNLRSRVTRNFKNKTKIKTTKE